MFFVSSCLRGCWGDCIIDADFVSVAEFLASLLLGLLSVLLPLGLFIGAVAVCVYLARWYIDRQS